MGGPAGRARRAPQRGVLAHRHAQRAGARPQLADRRPAEGHAERRERRHRPVLTPLAALHRPAGTGEQVGEEPGEWWAPLLPLHAASAPTPSPLPLCLLFIDPQGQANKWVKNLVSGGRPYSLYMLLAPLPPRPSTPLSTLHRPAGTGEQVGEEPGEWWAPLLPLHAASAPTPVPLPLCLLLTYTLQSAECQLSLNRQRRITSI